MKPANLNDFVAILRRMTSTMSAGASFTEMLLFNHMAMNCYNVEIDSDTGMHTIVYVPDEYPDLYDGPVLVKATEILNLIRTQQKAVSEIRTEKKLPPKCAESELFYERTETGIDLKFKFSLYDQQTIQYTEYTIKPRKKKGISDIVEKTKDKVVCGDCIYEKEVSYHMDYVSVANPIVANIVQTYYSMLERAKGDPVVIDGLAEGIYEKVNAQASLYYHSVVVNKKIVKIPFIRSMFRNLSKFEEFRISVQETNLRRIYLYVLHFKSKGICEQHIAYVQEYSVEEVKD